MVNDDVKYFSIYVYNKDEFYDFLIKHKNIDINNTSISNVYDDEILKFKTFTSKTIFITLGFWRDFDIDMLLSYFGFFTAKKWKTNNLISGNEAIEDFYNYRVKKANKYLARRRQRVLDKVITEAVESNEFLCEEEGFKL